MDHSVEHIPNGSSGHEQSEVDVRTIVVSLAALLVGAMLVALLTIGIFRYFHTVNRVDETLKENPQQIPPEPRVEERPYEQRYDLSGNRSIALAPLPAPQLDIDLRARRPRLRAVEQWPRSRRRQSIGDHRRPRRQSRYVGLPRYWSRFM